MIKGKTVQLRMVREADLDLLFAYSNDVEGRGPYYPLFLTSEPQFRRRFEETGFWTDDHGELLVCDLEDHILGFVAYFKTSTYLDGFEVAARLFDLSMRDRGIMTEALSLFCYLLFKAKHINRLEARIMPGNGASKRMAEKCGFRFEGVAREALFHLGAYRDMEVYSLLRPEAPDTLEEALRRAG